MLTRRTLIGCGLSVAAVGAVGYKVWPRLDDYRDKVALQRQLPSSDPTLDELVRMATLAANGHNTQPWAFRLDGQTVSILPDFTRRTPVVDPDDHHLWVSLGCATENLFIAGAALGRAGAVTVGEGDEPQIDVALSRAPPGPQELYQSIPLRQSTRSPYDGQPVSGRDLALLEVAAQEEGVSVQLFTRRTDREAILELVVAGNTAQMDDPAWIDELVDWLRFSPARAISTNDGLFSACSGNPVLPEWIGRQLPDGVQEGFRDRQIPGSGPVVGRNCGLHRRPGRPSALDCCRARFPAVCASGDSAWHPHRASQPAGRSSGGPSGLRALAGHARSPTGPCDPLRPGARAADVPSASGQRRAGMKSASDLQVLCFFAATYAFTRSGIVLVVAWHGLDSTAVGSFGLTSRSDAMTSGGLR